MLLDFLFKKEPPQRLTVEQIHLLGQPRTVLMRRNPRARRYILRLSPDGTIKVTIPAFGSKREGRAFVERNRPWLERQQQRLADRPQPNGALSAGDRFLFRGEKVLLGLLSPTSLSLGNETIEIPAATQNLRPIIEKHLRRLAEAELPKSLWGFARHFQVPLRDVSIRNQKTRWGSCSRRGRVSLNWRLVQLPPFVSDYICLHELAHLREMNHSKSYWKVVEHLCPHYRTAERWLKEHSREVLGR
jgi:predicted metal-dependent hydrolase